MFNDGQESILEENDNPEEGLLGYNPFQTWAENIYENSTHYIKEGTGINAMYLPTLVPYITKCMKLLPLWSGIMVPIYGYGDETASSAAVESSFKKLKTVTFKQENLPITIEDFLPRHIYSLRGASLIHSTKTSIPSNNNDEINRQSKITSQSDSDNKRLIETHKIVEEVEHTNMVSEQENDFLIIPEQSNCPLCSEGSDTGAHKCFYCGIPVHPISACSTYVPGNDDMRVCIICSLVETNVNEENNARETWCRINKKQRKTKSYLQPNPHLRHLNLNNSKQIKSLPILKNGSRSEELKSCKSTVTKGKIILTNTCAFDSLASLVMVPIFYIIYLVLNRCKIVYIIFYRYRIVIANHMLKKLILLDKVNF